jgi:thiamine pyrophosphate-dependent acetolactate synthase large subunit-like protein
VPAAGGAEVRRAAALLARSERPVLVPGSQAVLETDAPSELARALEVLGVPVFLAGSPRGLLGPSHPLQLRHRCKERCARPTWCCSPASRRISAWTTGVTSAAARAAGDVNRNAADLHHNRRPELDVHADPGRFLGRLAARLSPGAAAQSRSASGAPSGAEAGDAADGVSLGQGQGWDGWLRTPRARDDDREREIAEQALAEVPAVWSTRSRSAERSRACWRPTA